MIVVGLGIGMEVTAVGVSSVTVVVAGTMLVWIVGDVTINVVTE